MKTYIVCYSTKDWNDQCRVLAHSAEEAENIVRMNLPRTCRVSVVMWQR